MCNVYPVTAIMIIIFVGIELHLPLPHTPSNYYLRGVSLGCVGSPPLHATELSQVDPRRRHTRQRVVTQSLLTVTE